MECIESQWNQVARRYSVPDDEPDDAGGFIHKIDQFYCRTRDLYPRDERHVLFGPLQPTPWLCPNDLPLERIVKLLVRRNNQVQPGTKGCKPKCHTNGWCICSNKDRVRAARRTGSRQNRDRLRMA